MPVVLRARGLRFVIYVDDHEPAQVHVFGRGTAKIQFAGPVCLIHQRGMTAADVKKALNAVESVQDMMLAAWSRIHG